MKVDKIKLHKIISVACAVVIALTTLIYIAVPAMAADSWTDWATAPAAAQQLAQAYYDAWQTNDDNNIASYLSDWTDIPISWLKASTAFSSGYILSPTDDIIYYLDENGLLYKEVIRAGGAGRSRVGSSDDIDISGETFADIVARLNEHYAPNSLNFISYKKDVRWGPHQDDNDILYLTSFYFEGTFCNKWSEIYILPATFVDDNYYAIYNIHLSQAVTEVDGSNVIYLDWEVLSALTGEVVSSGQINHINFATVRYFDIACKGGVTWTDFRPYDCYTSYLSRSQSMSLFGVPWDDIHELYTSRDLANSDLSNYKLRYNLTPQSETADTYDSGFIVSDEPILLGYDCTGIDPTKIHNDAIINMGGDNINDYTITYGDTTTTIHEYITNNYEFGDTIINEGDTIIDVDFGDFILEIGTTIETSIKNSLNILFVPDDGFMDDKLDELKLNLESKLPVIADLPDIFSELFVEMDEDGNIIHSSLEDGTQGDPVISGDYAEDIYPKWEINVEFYGHEMRLTLLDFSIFKEVLPYVRLIIMAFVYVVYIRNFVNYLPTLVGNLVSMGGNVSAIADGSNTDPYVKVNQYTGEVYSYRM